jgi:hypothetical protein
MRIEPSSSITIMSLLGVGPPFWEILGRLGIGLSSPKLGMLVEARLFPSLSVPLIDVEPFIWISVLPLSVVSASASTFFDRFGMSSKIFSPSVGTSMAFMGFSSTAVDLQFG